jgi:hypothetical protein
MDFKFLPEPRDRQNMIQKNYQVLLLPDKLIMYLTLHELAYYFKVQYDPYYMLTFYCSKNIF